MRIMLNPAIDIRSFTAQFARTGAAVIPNILRPDTAQRAHRALCGLPWRIEVSDYSQTGKLRVPLPGDLPRNHLIGILDRTPHEIDPERLFFMRLACAREEFDDPMLSGLADFLDSEAFLGTARTLVGMPDLTHAFVEATAYDRGCFLGGHRDDHHPGNRVAFVLNLTPQWQLDWGGLLLLRANDGPPAIVPPVWNSLAMFRVPVDHLVSSVSFAAAGRRYSLTGWLRP